MTKEEIKEQVQQIPISEIRPFKNHPFKVADDDRMRETAESIRDYGVLVPAIVRPRSEGGYEIISGHRRKRASEMAGKETMPVIVRELDDDAAIIIMVDSNLQRENILPSERAAAYKMKVEALRRKAGRPSKENSSQLGTNFRADQVVAEQAGSSRNQVQRYIRLNNLVQPLLDMVDDRKIALNPAVELSFLKPEEQIKLVDGIEKQQATPSLSQAQRMKQLSQEGQLSSEHISSILSEVKKPQKISKETSIPPKEAQLIQNHSNQKQEVLLLDGGFIKLPIEPFLKFLPKSLFQNPTPESQEKLTKLFLKMAELYKKWITKKREQQR